MANKIHGPCADVARRIPLGSCIRGDEVQTELRACCEQVLMHSSGGGGGKGCRGAHCFCIYRVLKLRSMRFRWGCCWCVISLYILMVNIEEFSTILMGKTGGKMNFRYDGKCYTLCCIWHAAADYFFFFLMERNSFQPLHFIERVVSK